ncbi:MAG TPA: FGGY family carbohydrate kinase [Candidatus Dormibacteraeota bacterium]|nr:FGGY family carbohydrate kinase [Candidatus Dormibacteraeota bacterium]
MSRRYLLGIDQGTTGTKAVLFDDQLQVVDEAYEAIRVEHPRSGWVEQNPEQLIESIALTVRKVLPSDGEVIAAGLDNQGETIVAWDRESGKALAPVIVWQDKRSLEMVDRLEGSTRGKEIFERSRLPLDPYFSASKFSWLMENAPEVQAAHRNGSLVLGTSDVWLRYRLGADVATDPSTASRTQLLDLLSGRWDDRLLRAFELDPRAMPAIHATTGDLGNLSHPDWPVSIPLRASLVDQQAALAGHGCFQKGQVKATYGTGVFVLTNAGPEVPAIDGLLPTIAWRLGDELTYALDGGVFTAGTMVDWLRDELGLFGDAAQTGALAMSVEDAGGVQFLPALAGLGAPWWRADAAGVIAGLRSSTRKAHIVRAALEGIAQRVADIVDRIRERFDVPSMSIDGGLTKNAFLVQYQADLLGIPVLRPSTTEATALGAAALAGVGAGVFGGLIELQESLRAASSVDPGKSVDWRRRQRDSWQEFVTRQTRR